MAIGRGKFRHHIRVETPGTRGAGARGDAWNVKWDGFAHIEFKGVTVGDADIGIQVPRNTLHITVHNDQNTILINSGDRVRVVVTEPVDPSLVGQPAPAITHAIDEDAHIYDVVSASVVYGHNNPHDDNILIICESGRPI